MPNLATYWFGVWLNTILPLLQPNTMGEVGSSLWQR